MRFCIISITRLAIRDFAIGPNGIVFLRIVTIFGIWDGVGDKVICQNRVDWTGGGGGKA